MRSGVCRICRFVSVGLKPETLKLAVQHPNTGQPRLFVIKRESTVADFERLLKVEFPSVSTFNFYIHDTKGDKISLPAVDRSRISFFNEMKDSELAIEADGSEIGMRYDTSSSELKKRFILDLAENTIKQNLIANKSSVLKTEFSEYLSTQFKTDFKSAIEVARPEVEQRKTAIEALIAKWEAFRTQFLDFSVKRSLKPVKVLLFLSSMQFSLLFYLTFFQYDWNVVEPISYLMALGLQFGLVGGYALKKRYFGPEFVFKTAMEKMNVKLERNLFYAEELYIKKKALENLLILFK